MSLALALMAAINGSTGSSATLSHGLKLRDQPQRRLSGGRPGCSSIIGGAQAATDAVAQTRAARARRQSQPAPNELSPSGVRSRRLRGKVSIPPRDRLCRYTNFGAPRAVCATASDESRSGGDILEISAFTYGDSPAGDELLTSGRATKSVAGPRPRGCCCPTRVAGGAGTGVEIVAAFVSERSSARPLPGSRDSPDPQLSLAMPVAPAFVAMRSRGPAASGPVLRRRGDRALRRRADDRVRPDAHPVDRHPDRLHVLARKRPAG